jgi:predicted DNA-binding transcriptional regulator AlpA
MSDKALPMGAMERQIVPALLTLKLIRQHYVPAGERTLQRWISSGLFPKPDIAIGGKVRYWRRETVDAWIADRATDTGAKA